MTIEELARALSQLPRARPMDLETWLRLSRQGPTWRERVRQLGRHYPDATLALRGGAERRTP